MGRSGKSDFAGSLDRFCLSRGFPDNRKILGKLWNFYRPTEIPEADIHAERGERRLQAQNGSCGCATLAINKEMPGFEIHA
jgi:hypothetical protein